MLACAFAVFGAAAATCGDVGAAQILRVDRVWNQAPHNAFTDLVRYDDRFFLAFREASQHGVPGVGTDGGNLRVLESSDGVAWKSAALIDGGPNLDLRDAKLARTPGGQLMLTGAAAPQDSPSQRQSLAWLSSDGAEWSTPESIGDPNYWLWGVEWHDGAAYSVGYGPTTTSASNWNTRLYRSGDGREFDPLVATLNSGAGPSEAGLLFQTDGTAVALVRRDAGSQTALVGTSSGDYTQWTWRDTGVRVGGPELIEIPDGRIVAATRLYDGGQRTALSFLDPASGALDEFLTLPSGGDTSYAGMVWHDDRLWVSYYSSHEGKSNIYIAEVDVDAPPSLAPILHLEDIDPATEGWLAYNGGAGVATNGPINDDGLPAWNITDTSTAGGSRGGWVRSLTSEQLTEADSGGWKMSGRVRVENSPDAPDGAVELSAFLSDTRGFVLWLGSDAQGNALVSELVGTAASGLNVGRTATLAGGGYHDYEMIFDPASDSVDVYVDGALAIENYLGMTTSSSLNRILWGANASAGVGSGNYRRVEFEVFGAFAVDAPDLNWDGAVDIFDVASVSGHWGASGPVGVPGDANRDGEVDIFDVAVVSAHWSADATAIPEPASFTLLLGGAALLATASRGRRALAGRPRDSASFRMRT